LPDEPLVRKHNRSLLNKTNCKKYALDIAHKTRPSVKFTRVSHSFIDAVEVAVRNKVEYMVHCSPSRRTLTQ